MMSPGSKTRVSSSITASVGRPALTMMIAVRGFCRLAANSSYEKAGTKPASGCAASSSSVLARLRFSTATVFPSRLARLRARLDPMTASPTTPMFADASGTESSSTWVRTLRLSAGARPGSERYTAGGPERVLRGSVLAVARAAHRVHRGERRHGAADDDRTDDPEDDVCEECGIKHGNSLSRFRVR